MKKNPHLNLWRVFFAIGMALFVMGWSVTAYSTSSYPTLIQHDLFGLSKGATLEQVTQQWGGLPSPFKQPHHYLLRYPPNPSAAFPMIVVTATKETGICAVGGVFAGKKDQPSTVKNMIDLVMTFSQQYGSPTTSEEGKILWEKLPPNTQSISSIAILTDQLPEEITLISLVYYLDNFEACQLIEEQTPTVSEISKHLEIK